ncbi:hypothetical protein NPIL_546311 [Nephila pilipes]|uniref:Uncharacterized protein n=1 Tax=Nephila pilipes TaxID=299642 RepID=A0A8X6JMJ3_NEPPI|nr:hypothetical protein NPIL_546311 [Nephila pilipes]
MSQRTLSSMTVPSERSTKLAKEDGGMKVFSRGRVEKKKKVPKIFQNPSVFQDDFTLEQSVQVNFERSPPITCVLSVVPRNSFFGLLHTRTSCFDAGDGSLSSVQMRAKF